MIYSIEQIASALKAAREDKQLTQRELSRKVWLPQSQISRIETGAVDLRLSSLIALSRALDLELILVPRKLVPAVQSLVRSSKTTDREATQRARTERKVLKRLGTTAKELERIQPDLQSLRSLQQTADQLKQFRLSSGMLEQLRKAANGLQNLQKSFENLKRHSLNPDALRRIREIDQDLRHLRNTLAQQMSLHPEKIRTSVPAYRLDEDEADG